MSEKISADRSGSSTQITHKTVCVLFHEMCFSKDTTVIKCS